jgi:hypothetical protein
MIRLYAIAGLLAICLGLLWNGQRLTNRAEAAETALASAKAQILQVRAADEVHRTYLVVAAGIEAGYDALISEFEGMEGADAPLSDYLRTVDERLR